MRAAMLFVVLGLSGCAGSDAQMRLWENGNVVQIEPSQIKGVDYVIRMKTLSTSAMTQTTPPIDTQPHYD
ncbi:hypothetical protein IVB08_34655 [Bradyrhizobium sp. 173]|uniref:hypothetical protein n=1 Tax=Bradyrhizobium sp. 173 TaxID=2782644 RepID=UPI001FFACCDD|nr:hypothetical protein [Bradyrhizobium sp. 173]MCK1569001.1 hypothetical protein [Bradyrhizobium sp. 173]